MDWNNTSQLDQTQFDPAQVFAAALALHHIANTAYPIGHITTMRPYRIPRSRVQSVTPQAWEGIDKAGLYIHIPFCERRCGFCEYTVIAPDTNHENEALYFELLQREFKLLSQATDTQQLQLVGFDIGGGTPSLPAVNHIADVIETAQKYFFLPEQVTISIETTPKIAAQTPQKIHDYYQLGIRRISMGVQTINPRLLRSVGRDATSLSYNRFAVENIRSAGFSRFNIDVMYGFAGQSIDSVKATLQHVIDLEPEYVTLYQMRYKGTRLSHQANQVTRDQIYAHYRLAKQMLLTSGYQGSEGKNTFSRLSGDVGTSDYLTERVIHGTPYLGLGLGAQSLSHQTLSYNAGAADKQLRNYQRMLDAGKLPIQDLYHLSLEAAMGKMIAISFYFGEINLSSFEDKLGIKLQKAFPQEISFLIENDLMAYYAKDQRLSVADRGAAKTLRLTPKGEAQVNGVIAQFYSGAVKSHLIALANKPFESSPAHTQILQSTPV